MSLKVIQWSTGNVGRYALRAIIDHPELELVGLFVSSETKEGKDPGSSAASTRLASLQPATWTLFSL